MSKLLRAAVAGVGLLAAIGPGAAYAQDAAPAPFPAVPSAPLDAPEFEPISDPDVQLAQLQQYAPAAGPGAPSNPPRPVADPPSPVVRVQVRVPADTPPGDEIKYLITVRNASAAEAHKVAVLCPLPATVADVVKVDPPPTKPSAPGHIKVEGNATMTATELVWSFGTLKPGEAKTVELVLRPKPDASEVKVFAYVRFEHGEAVTTRIHKPALRVTKAQPKQAVRDEPFKVSIAVENRGRVPTANVRVTENVPGAAEVEPLTPGGKKLKDGQWEWSLGTLHPGQRKAIEYRLTPRQVEETLTTTHVAADKAVLEKAEARTAVLVPALGIKLARIDEKRAPIRADAVVPPGETAVYEITVRNTGTLPSTDVRVTGTVPADCQLRKRTNGGQLARDQVTWSVPRLEPGEAQSFRLWLRATSSGSRVVGAAAVDARGTRTKDEAATVFQGVAVLVWETVPDPPTIYVGRQGTFTVRVRNNGGEAARDVRVAVELPPDVECVQATKDVRPVGRKLAFGPDAIPPFGEQVYTVTYKATRASEAWFKARLSAESLGDRPLQTEKVVDILGKAAG